MLIYTAIIQDEKQIKKSEITTQNNFCLIISRNNARRSEKRTNIVANF